jgi:serine/threonine-protein kinase
MGRYEVVATLGKGGFGHVYRVSDLSGGGAQRAVKHLIPDTTGQFRDGEQQGLWRQEVTTVSKLSHPGLPQVFEWFYLPNGFFIVMEFVSGKLLDAILKQQRAPLRQEEALFWGVEIADMLNYLHGQKPHPIIYGDLKPENIMITEEGHAKMIDFGVARFLDPGRKLPQTFTMVSPGFSPPEQYKSPNIDQRSDIYALGATLYHMLTKENLERYKFRVPQVHMFRKDVHPDLDAILDLCLMEKPAERYQNISEVYRDILNIFNELRETA